MPHFFFNSCFNPRNKENMVIVKSFWLGISKGNIFISSVISLQVSMQLVYILLLFVSYYYLYWSFHLNRYYFWNFKKTSQCCQFISCQKKKKISYYFLDNFFLIIIIKFALLSIISGFAIFIDKLRMNLMGKSWSKVLALIFLFLKKVFVHAKAHSYHYCQLNCFQTDITSENYFRKLKKYIYLTNRDALIII